MSGFNNTAIVYRNNANIYTMFMHELCVVEEGSLFTTVLRVPGGWIYRCYDKSHHILSAIFVPYVNEGGSP